MTTKKSSADLKPHRALGAAVLLFGRDNDIPLWVHLLEHGENPTVDGRGPFMADDMAAIIAMSLAKSVDGKLPIDVNHAIDKAAPNGGPSPAAGWIVELQARDTGLWGRVEWTPHGLSLLGDQSYRYLSPVLLHSRTTNQVLWVARASLVNYPALHGLEPVLNAGETENDDMDFLKKLNAALGLDVTSPEAATLAAVTALTHTQATSLSAIATAVGLNADADVAQVVLAAEKLKTPDPAKFVPAAQVATLAAQVETLTLDAKKKAATDFIDTAILAGRMNVKHLRDHYIARHMSDAAGVEKEINSFSILAAGSVMPTATDKDNPGQLTAAQMVACAALGVEPEAYAKTLATQNKGAF